MNVVEFSNKVLEETKKIIVGKDEKIELIIMAILSNGHVLLDDLPGVGKTTLVKTMSIALGCNSKRIQFVPDMLPSDIIGMNIYNQKTMDFEYKEGPVMTNILLADEINRAIPRTQSALLEAMEEHKVTIDGVIHDISEPFCVLATQNPVESESTFRLPAAQMDRFMIKLSIGYPTAEEERKMLENLGDQIPFDSIKRVSSPEEIINLQKEISSVHVSSAIADYIIAICNETRKDNRLKMGASPRASRALYKACKTWSAMHGRDYVTPDDVKYLVHPVLEHRLALDGSTRFSGTSATKILDDILKKVAVNEK